MGEQVIAECQRAWPARFRARFGVEAAPVLARALVTHTSGASLLGAREELGRAIGALKGVACHPELGILQRITL